jgi:hypothetical protein
VLILNVLKSGFNVEATGSTEVVQGLVFAGWEVEMVEVLLIAQLSPPVSLFLTVSCIIWFSSFVVSFSSFFLCMLLNSICCPNVTQTEKKKAVSMQ